MDFEKEFTVEEDDSSIEIEVVTEGNGLTSKQSQSVSISKGDTVKISLKTK